MTQKLKTNICDNIQILIFKTCYKNIIFLLLYNHTLIWIGPLRKLPIKYVRILLRCYLHFLRMENWHSTEIFRGSYNLILHNYCILYPSDYLIYLSCQQWKLLCDYNSALIYYNLPFKVQYWLLCLFCCH